MSYVVRASAVCYRTIRLGCQLDGRTVAGISFPEISLRRWRRTKRIIRATLGSLEPMTRYVAEIAADFDALTTADFDFAPGTSGWERLAALCDEMRAVNDPVECAPVMFHTIERLDGVNLGTPGPLVHTLESWRGGYEEVLVQSVRRKPTPLSV